MYRPPCSPPARDGRHREGCRGHLIPKRIGGGPAVRIARNAWVFVRQLASRGANNEIVDSIPSVQPIQIDDFHVRPCAGGGDDRRSERCAEQKQLGAGRPGSDCPTRRLEPT